MCIQEKLLDSHKISFSKVLFSQDNDDVDAVADRGDDDVTDNRGLIVLQDRQVEMLRKIM